ncbi:hypothetical protein MMC08_002369 [Hypocenomyce scalaris]|nr:hypothetical protein [Hypocenomyce scalaris]
MAPLPQLVYLPPSISNDTTIPLGCPPGEICLHFRSVLQDIISSANGSLNSNVTDTSERSFTSFYADPNDPHLVLKEFAFYVLTVVAVMVALIVLTICCSMPCRKPRVRKPAVTRTTTNTTNNTTTTATNTNAAAQYELELQTRTTAAADVQLRNLQPSETPVSITAVQAPELAAYSNAPPRSTTNRQESSSSLPKYEVEEKLPGYDEVGKN